MNKPKTGPATFKPYQCTGCRHEQQEKTNHWGQLYQQCPVCRQLIAWNCLEQIPEEYDKPDDWKLINLRDMKLEGD